MQRRLAVVHQRLGHGADRRPVVVHQDDQLLDHRPPSSPTHRRPRPAVPRRAPVRPAGWPRGQLLAATAWSSTSATPARADGEPVVLLHGFPQDSTACDRRRARCCTRPGCARSPPTSAATPPAPGRAAGAAYRLRETVDDVAGAAGRRRAGRARTSSGTTGAASSAWALAAWHPERVRTLTALSVPHPAAMAKALVTSDQALRSYYMAAVPAAGAARAAAARRAAARRCAGCCARGGLPAEAGRPLRRAGCASRGP